MKNTKELFFFLLLLSVKIFTPVFTLQLFSAKAYTKTGCCCCCVGAAAE